jgi:hypothetical protein
MLRTKTLEIDGVKLKIASLSLDQVDEIYAKPTPDGKVKGGKRTVILASLNRVDPADQWDEKRYNAEFDLVLVDTVFDEVVAFSGLNPKEKPSGETGAASGISSATSDAA